MHIIAKPKSIVYIYFLTGRKKVVTRPSESERMKKIDLKANSLSTVNSGGEYNPRLFDVHINQSLNGDWIYGQRKPGYFGVA